MLSRRFIKKTFTRKSSVHGQGIFTSTDIKKGDIIIQDLFEHKPKDLVLYDGIPDSKFYHYLSDEAAKLNHCSRNDNSVIVTKDRKTYTLFAKNNIKQGSEITVNYDETHNKYPFIGGSKKGYKTC